MIVSEDINYDSDETIDDPTHPPTKAEEQSLKQQPSQQKAMHTNPRDIFNLPLNKSILQTNQKEAKSKTPLPPPQPLSQDTETAYDTDATISEPIDAEESPEHKQADRKIFQHAMRQRRAWNLENEEEGMSAKVPLPVYNTRIV